MTVTYSLDVSTSGFFTFTKVLFRWRGSVYKALWKELVGFLIIYFSLHLMYIYGLDADGKQVFGVVAQYCQKAVEYIPLSFILGFYVTIIFNRWWGQFEAIAWPDSATLFVGCYLEGPDERAKLYRRTIARYLNLSAALGLRNGSSAVKKRFPTMEHLIEAGMMTEEEYKAFEAVPTRFAKQWVPCQWAMNLCVIARKEGMIKNDFALIELVTAINNFRLLVRDTAFYDWMSVPLVYTQVVTLAVYSYFVACLMGRQHHELYDEFIYFPVFTILQFLFYVGWLKVAECMINPYGEDDDDFEVNFIIDRNLQTGYVFADDNAFTVPPLSQDIFWDTQDVHIPHTAASYGIKSAGFEGSASGIIVPRNMTDLVVEDFQVPHECFEHQRQESPEKQPRDAAVTSLSEHTPRGSSGDIAGQAKEQPQPTADAWTTEFMRRISRVIHRDRRARERMDRNASRTSSTRSNKESDSDKGQSSQASSRKTSGNNGRKMSILHTRPLGSRPGSWLRSGSIVDLNGVPVNAPAGRSNPAFVDETPLRDIRFMVSSSESIDQNGHIPSRQESAQSAPPDFARSIAGRTTSSLDVPQHHKLDTISENSCRDANMLYIRETSSDPNFTAEAGQLHVDPLSNKPAIRFGVAKNYGPPEAVVPLTEKAIADRALVEKYFLEYIEKDTREHGESEEEVRRVVNSHKLAFETEREWCNYSKIAMSKNRLETNALIAELYTAKKKAQEKLANKGPSVKKAKSKMKDCFECGDIVKSFYPVEGDRSKFRCAECQALHGIEEHMLRYATVQLSRISIL